MATNNYILKELVAGGTVKDYRHAARIFVDSNYRLAPKNSFLFHVAFDVDVALSLQGQEQVLEAGLLVKSAGLPQFTVDTKPCNAYNRPNIVQTKVKYNALDIVFHDDNADIVRDFWYNYYSFYYRDGDTNLIAQNAPHKYQERINDRWGYTLRADSTTPKVLRSIRIYVLHQKRFTEYLLVNPTITRWAGSELNTSLTTETAESRMTVEYEAVIFSSGTLIKDNVKSFFNLKYDRQASDITPGIVDSTSEAYINAGLLGPDSEKSLPDQIRNGYNKIVSTAGEFAGAARDIRNTIQQANQFKKDVRAFQTGYKDFKNFGKYILQGSNPFAQIRVPDLTNLSKGIAQSSGQVGRAVGAVQGIFGGQTIGGSLSTSPLGRAAGSVSSNQSDVSSSPPAPTYWTSTADGAKPPLPSMPATTNQSASTTSQLSAVKSTNTGNVESAVIGSGYVKEIQSTLTKTAFTKDSSAISVSNLIDRLDEATMEQQQQQNFVEQYLNTKSSDSEQGE